MTVFMKLPMKLHRHARAILLRQSGIVIVGSLLLLLSFYSFSILEEKARQLPPLLSRYHLLLHVQHTYGNGPYDSLLNKVSYSLEDIEEIAKEYGVTLKALNGNGPAKELTLQAKTDLDIFQFLQEVQDCYSKSMSWRYFSVSREPIGVQGKVIIHETD